ncbi:MAG: penicillin-binding transpeptidase domain-containing protein [Hansschlegelia sp.]
MLASALGALLVGLAPAAAQGPADLRSAFGEAFSGADACVALRDVAPGAQTAVSDPELCARRVPPCATFEIPASVIAIDRGVVPDANAPVKRQPPIEGDPADGVNLRDAFRKPAPWVYEEVARRIGSETFGRALGAMRYGTAESKGPVETLGRSPDVDGLVLSPVEQAEFLTRMKRGELPTSAESQARTVEIFPAENIGDSVLAIKSGSCSGTAWAVGWVNRGQRATIFAAVEIGAGVTAEDVSARARRLIGSLGLTPAPAR